MGSSQFYLNHFKAYGTSDASGNLTITITVAENSNISWLSFKDLMLENTASVTVSAKAGKYGTVIFPFTPDVSTGFDDIKFYSCSEVNSETNKVRLVEVVAPEANTPYLIKNNGEENFSKTLSGGITSTRDSYTVGLLTGVMTASTIPASANNYVLQTPTDGENEGVQAFYSVDANFTATAYKCYLTYTGSLSAKLIGFETADVDGIRSIDDEIMSNGERSEIFNLAGQRVSKAQKGIYIVNGKKVVIK